MITGHLTVGHPYACPLTFTCCPRAYLHTYTDKRHLQRENAKQSRQQAKRTNTKSQVCYFVLDMCTRVCVYIYVHMYKYMCAYIFCCPSNKEWHVRRCLRVGMCIAVCVCVRDGPQRVCWPESLAL